MNQNDNINKNGELHGVFFSFYKYISILKQCQINFVTVLWNKTETNVDTFNTNDIQNYDE